MFFTDPTDRFSPFADLFILIFLGGAPIEKWNFTEHLYSSEKKVTRPTNFWNVFARKNIFFFLASALKLLK